MTRQTSPVPRPSSLEGAEELGAEELLARVVEEFRPRLALACSFQKEESVLLHMLLRLAPDTRVFTIDTGVLFDETRATWRAVEERYGVKVEVHDALAGEGAPWTRERCCSDQKVAALGRALVGLDCWVTGMRREQAPTRAAVPKVAYDEPHGLWKVNPIADWTEREVWRFVEKHDLPYNELHDRGYASIGCAPCTLPGTGREGRWAGEDKTECGLHVVEA